MGVPVDIGAGELRRCLDLIRESALQLKLQAGRDSSPDVDRCVDRITVNTNIIYRLLEELERLVHSVQSDTINTVVHDLKSPLTVVRGFAELLRLYHAEWFDQKSQESIDQIIHNTVLMDRIVGDLLNDR